MKERKRTTIDVQRTEALKQFLRKKKISHTTVADAIGVCKSTLNGRFHDFDTFTIGELRVISGLCGIMLPSLITYLAIPARILNTPDTGLRWMDDNNLLREKNRELTKANEKMKRGLKGHFKKRSRYMIEDGNLHRWKEELNEKLN